MSRARCGVVAALLLSFCLVLPSAAGADKARIINGDTNAAGLVIPWQVGLVPRKGDEVTTGVFCGGTVRDATHVITAAHCLPNKNADELAVIAGVADRTELGGGNIFLVKSISTHPSYDDPAQANDVAVITLTSPMPLGGQIRALPVIPAGGNPGTVAMISGWGDITLDPQTTESPEVVRYTFINVLADSACGSYGDVFLPANMLCAGYKENGTVYDTCQGDSGGPLARYAGDGTTVSLDDMDRLIGVVSFGRGCADPEYPGIYARLSAADLNARVTAANPPARTEPTAEPAVEGDVAATRSVTCNGGGWTGNPTLSYRWGSAKVEGEQVSDQKLIGEGQTLTIPADEVGRAVFCLVRAAGPGGYRTAASPGHVVADAPQSTGPDTGPGTGTGVLPGLPGVPGAGTGGPAPVAPGPSVTPQVINDVVVPVAAFTRRSCSTRVCKLTVTAGDSGGPATALAATVARVSGCKKGAKGRRCRAAKALTAASGGPGVFTLKTGRLKPGRYRFVVIATDAAGNRSAAQTVVLKVKR